MVLAGRVDGRVDAESKAVSISDDDERLQRALWADDEEEGSTRREVEAGHIEEKLRRELFEGRRRS